MKTTRDEGQTHTMLHVVLSHTVSPRTNPGPRNAVPQDTGRIQAQHGYSRPSSVPRPIVSALAHCQCPAHCQCSGPWSVRRSIVSARPMVGAQAHCQCQAHGQCSGPWSVPSLLSVLRPMVGAHTENRGQAPSTTLYSAQQGHAGDGKHAPLVPRSACLPRLMPGVRPSGREANLQDTRPRQRHPKTGAPPRQRPSKTKAIQDSEDPRQHTLPDHQHHALPGIARPQPPGVSGDASMACLSAWPNKRLQATGHSGHLLAGVGLYHVARA